MVESSCLSASRLKLGWESHLKLNSDTMDRKNPVDSVSRACVDISIFEHLSCWSLGEPTIRYLLV